jgi:dienelactone hydrolase
VFGYDSGRHLKLADELAAQGYTVIVPDVFRGKAPARKLLGSQKLGHLRLLYSLFLWRWDGSLREDADEAVRIAAGGDDSGAEEGGSTEGGKNTPGQEKRSVAVLGFCFGGWVVGKLCGDAEEAINRLFCPSHEKFHDFVLRGLRNISEAP